ncbi:MAG: TrmH family RNA methyltransferase [Candidatus Pacebacteria bacterium]|nr:TrmH family RNA methyltransferase [Candidatus Paceibacterota bacterium]
MKQVRETYVVLHDIRSTQNVGAILRTCDAAGIDKVFFSGITPSPIDRFGRKRSDVAKSSLGAEDSVSWEVLEEGGKNVLDFLKEMKEDGFQIVALEQSPKSVDYKELNEKFPSEKRVVVLGNEVDGVSKEILELCDVVGEIPMLGEKESLNVSVAFGIFIFRILEI